MSAIGDRVTGLETRMSDVGQALSSLHQTMAQHALLAPQLLTSIGEMARSITGLQADMRELRAEVRSLRAEAQSLRGEQEGIRTVLSGILERLVEQGKVIRGFRTPGQS